MKRKVLTDLEMEQQFLREMKKDSKSTTVYGVAVRGALKKVNKELAKKVRK